MDDKHDPFYGLRPTDGLVALAAWRQKSHLADQSAALADELDEALAATREHAHIRRPDQGFRLNRRKYEASRTEQMDSSSVERRLEHAIWRQFSTSGDDARVASVWRQILSYQVPLYARQDHQGWGAADLVALSEDFLPSIVELKKSDSSESVLRPVIEAAAYAVSLKANWKTFIAEVATLPHLAIDPTALPKQAGPIPLVLLAPKQYWDSARDLSRLRGRRDGYWRDYRRLLTALEDRGLPTIFASVDGVGDADGGQGIVPSSLTVEVCADFPPQAE